MVRWVQYPVLPLLLAVIVAGAGADQRAQASRARIAEDAENHELALQCRGALWKLTFDEATAAGLNPGAIAVQFEAGKATTRRSDGQAFVTGVEDYQPVHDTKPFKVSYECVVDISSKRVTSVTYEAVDRLGNPVSARPTDLVRHARYVDACQTAIVVKINEKAVDKGITVGGSGAEFDAANATVTKKGTNTEIEGTGLVRLSRDYEWEAASYSCRFDDRKARISRASYTLADLSDIGALSPDRQAAMSRCREAVRDAVADDAQARGYRWWWRVEVRLEQVGNFKEAARGIEVSGDGWFRSDRDHPERTPITFACTYDPAADRVQRATFEAKPTGRTPSGEIASGKIGTLVCESINGVHKTCPAQIRGDVKVIRDFGRARCVAYENWIYSLSGITVWGDCRAEFEFDAR